MVGQHGARQSMSQRGNCYDNTLPSTIHTKSFGSRFKAELLNGSRCPGLAETRLKITHHIAYYHAERQNFTLR